MCVQVRELCNVKITLGEEQSLEYLTYNLWVGSYLHFWFLKIFSTLGLWNTRNFSTDPFEPLMKPKKYHHSKSKWTYE